METKEELLKTYNTAKAELKEWEAIAEVNPTEFNKDKVEEFELIVSGLDYDIKNYGKGGCGIKSSLKKTEVTRVRINYKISAKGLFQPDITSEAETVETAISNLNDAKTKLDEWAIAQGFVTE